VGTHERTDGWTEGQAETRHSYTSDYTPRYRKAAPRIAIRPTMTKRHVIHKVEVHNVTQRRQRRTEPRP